VTSGLEENGPVEPRRTWRLILFIILLGCAIALLRSDLLGPGFSVDGLQRRVADTGWFGPFIFIAVFTILTNLIFPTSLMLVAAGMMFGGVPGFLIGAGASLLAYALGYALSVIFARDAVRGLASRMGWSPILSTIEERSPFRVSFAARYIPIPVGAQSYLLGLTRLPFLPYLLGSMAGSLPWIFVYAQIGASANISRSVSFWLGLAACLLLIFLADRWWHRRKAR
jgi:uncharacterized membrane protein YdjX (TVP38/TMEM64 family)